MSFTVQLVYGLPGGLDPRKYFLELTWTDSTDPNAVSVNVYRSTVSGGPYTLMGNVAQGVQLYDDFTTVQGLTYFYVLTEVNNTSNESAFSTEVSGFAGPH